MKNQIVIWGAGNQGREAYYNLSRYFETLGFYDSDHGKIGLEIVDGKRVLEYQREKTLIVIACAKWMEVSRVLQNRGLRLLEDFIPYNMLLKKRIWLNDLMDCFTVSDLLEYLCEIRKNKKLALIYGNCQTDIIANMLEYNSGFTKQYMLLRVPQIHLYRDEEQIDQIFYKNGIMQMIDLFIFQNVKDNNRFSPNLGTDNILTQMNDKCRKLPIHNIYFDGYFIQYDADDDRYFNNLNQKDFPYTDGIVDRLIKDKRSVDEIINIISDENLETKEKILEKCEISINNLRQREEHVEVPIVDYIEKKYMNEQLFYTYNHPKTKVIYEYVKRMLNTLGIDKIDEFTEEELNMEFGTLRINNFPVLPCVIKALGLRKFESKMRISHISHRLVTLDEYFREYIYRCYGIG